MYGLEYIPQMAVIPQLLIAPRTRQRAHDVFVYRDSNLSVAIHAGDADVRNLGEIHSDCALRCHLLLGFRPAPVRGRVCLSASIRACISECDTWSTLRSAAENVLYSAVRGFAFT